MIDFKRLNELVQQDIELAIDLERNKLLYHISKNIVQKQKMNNCSLYFMRTKSNIENSKRVALDFFKNIGQGLYKKAEAILKGKSDVEVREHKFDPNGTEIVKEKDGKEYHTKTPSLRLENGKFVFYLPYYETVKDIYTIVHEISHTFDYSKEDTSTHYFLGEVTSNMFETMLGKYLAEKEVIPLCEILEIEKESRISNYDEAVEVLAMLELMKAKKEKGIIEETDIRKLQDEYGVKEDAVGFVINKIIDTHKSLYLGARYMMAGLVVPKVIQDYEKNPKEFIVKLEHYFKSVKEDDYQGTLDILGIDLSIDCKEKNTGKVGIEGLIEKANEHKKRLDEEMEKTKMKKTKLDNLKSMTSGVDVGKITTVKSTIEKETINEERKINE